MGIKEYLFESFNSVFANRKEAEEVTVYPVNTVIPDEDEDGSLVINPISYGGGFTGTYLDLSIIDTKNEAELITRYRELASESLFDYAIQEVVNEIVIIDEDEDPIKLNLDKLPLPDKIKDKISFEFENILRLLNFTSKGYDIVRQWYVDGRLYYHVIFDEKNINFGIQEIRNIDPRKIKKVKEVEKNKDTNGIETIKSQKEYFIFNEKGQAYTGGIKIHPDRVCFVHSGLKNARSNTIVSHIHKAIRNYNQLRLLEESVIIYRFTKAPSRRVFYVDVGGMAPKKAEKYVQDLMNRYRNKIVFDAESGTVKEEKKYMSMLEDYWIPRMGERGTKIETIGGEQLSNNMEDVEYFKREFYLSLNVPIGRLEPSTGFNMGRSSEISREEVKFSRFVTKLRVRFSQLFDSLLEKQVISKGIIAPQDWDQIKHLVGYKFNIDDHFRELLEQEVLQTRLNILNELQPFTSKGALGQPNVYFSEDWVKKHVLMRTDDENKLNDSAIEQEIEIASKNVFAQIQQAQAELEQQSSQPKAKK